MALQEIVWVRDFPVRYARSLNKFHVAKHLHAAVDRVRRTEDRALKQADDTRLTGTKYLWLMRPLAMHAAQRTTFRTLQHTDMKDTPS